MELTCDACGEEVLEIDVKCPNCGHNLTSTGAHRMLGKVVLEQYEIIDILGQGGMSVVYKGRHKLTEQEVALKILPPELAAHSQVKSRFVEEARALAQLDHPNIVHLYNFGQENGCFVLAMQYVHGRTFERMIIDAEALDWTVAARVAVDVLSALEYAHSRGIIHRDMKPSNILVRDQDGSATVMDFGIAKMTTSTKLTATGQTMGTVRYMSPEQVRGQTVDARTDIYSLGATLYEAVCGDTPFDGDTHFEIMSKHLHEAPRPPSLDGVVLPIAFEQVLMRSLAKRPEDRFGSASEFSEALERLLSDADVGHAETLRMSRDMLKHPPPGRDRAQAVTQGEATRRLTPQSAMDANPVTAAASVPSGIPSNSLASDVSGDFEPLDRLDPLDAAAHGGSRRTPLFVGLAAALVVGAGVGAWVLTRSSPEAPPQTAPPPVRWPEPFLPEGIRFEVKRDYPDAELRVLAPADWDPEKLRQMYEAGVIRFSQLLAEEKLADEVPSQPISILVVSQDVFCDPRTYDTPQDLGGCEKEELWYRPQERTLLIVDRQDRAGFNIAVGAATAVCTHEDIDNCGRASRMFEDRLRAGDGAKRP